MTEADRLVAETPTVADAGRYRLTRAGIHNVWQYADQIFQFADGRLLLRGRNGAGKSKALEMLLPFLLDGDTRRLDTTGSGRTGLRWLMRESRSFGDGPLRGYVWVEFVRGTQEGDEVRRTLGCAVSAVPDEDTAHPVFFVTDLQVGAELDLYTDEHGPMSLERLHETVGADNCYRDAVSYRSRVMQELFGLDDPVRYRNLVHLLHRLRRPTIGERIEAGELVSVLAEALPPTDETILDTLAQHLSGLDAARGRLRALRAASTSIDELLTDYRSYLRGALHRRVADVETHLETYESSAATVERLRTTVDECRTVEAEQQEERDRLRRTRDTTTDDDASLANAANVTTAPSTAEQRAHNAAVGAYTRAAEAAAAGAEHARAAEKHALDHLSASTTGLHQQLEQVRTLHGQCGEAARAAGLDPPERMPQPGTSVLAARESRTLVDLEGLEHAVEHDQVSGLDSTDLQSGLDRLADGLDHLATHAANRRTVAAALHARTGDLAEAQQRASALRDEAEWLDGQLELTVRRERHAHEQVRAVSDTYTAAVREWILQVRAETPETGPDLSELDRHAALPVDNTTQPHSTDLPATVTRAATESVGAVVGELLKLRDGNVAEQCELGSELGDLASRKRGATETQPDPLGTRSETTDTADSEQGTANTAETAELDRRIAIAEALLAETRERHTELAARHDRMRELLRNLPSGAELQSAWAVADSVAEARATASREAQRAAHRADAALSEEHSLREEVTETAARHGLPTTRSELADLLAALSRTEVLLDTLRTALAGLTAAVQRYGTEVAAWQRLRTERISAEDARTAAIQDMISVRRDIELTDRARSATSEQIEHSRGEVQGRGAQARTRLPQLERAAHEARDARVAAETRYELAERELAEAATRALTAGTELRRLLGEPELDESLLDGVGVSQLADQNSPIHAFDTAVHQGQPEDDSSARASAVAALRRLTTALGEALSSSETSEYSTGSEAPEGSDTPDDNDILRGYQRLAQRLTTTSAEIDLRLELGETRAVKRLHIVDDRGTHDIARYATHLADMIAEAEKNVRVREEEAYERQLLGELAGHLYQQITEARALVATMNEVLGEVTTSQGIGARLAWELAPDADSDISAVVPLLERPPEERTRLETTQLRDALRRCIEAIRRLDPGASHGAQLRAALDYRSWFAFTVYVADSAREHVERPLTSRTALSQGEQRVIAYLVLFAAAAAQFGALAQRAPHAPRLILLDDAFAKVDEPTHGRLLGLLAELDLDFVLTSERLWGCFASVPSLHIYECMRDPQVRGIATLHFSWDGHRRRMLGD